jgi:hypothetical protein
MVMVTGIALGCRTARTSLVDRMDEARLDAEDGLYAGFLDRPSDRGPVRLEGEVKPSLTPPFPATVRFDLVLPEAAFLSFAPALVTRQDVRRAGVEFVVRVEAEGESLVLFTELFDSEDANRWHDRAVDLTGWGGREVTLALETRAIAGRPGKLWADRIQTAWGDPVVASNRPLQVARSASAAALQAREWILRQAERGGLARENTERALLFAVNLIVAGLLSLAIRELFVRFGSVATDRGRFGNLFPLVTMGTVVLITVVQASLALSLGLLGALSIVRFRSAIKTPEELVYLLFCVSVGLALGADHRLLAITTVLVVGAYVAARSWLRAPDIEKSFLLAISGDASRLFAGGTQGVESVLDTVGGAVRALDFQRFDRDRERFELRTVVTVESTEAEALVRDLRERLPGFDVSCVDTDVVS